MHFLSNIYQCCKVKKDCNSKEGYTKKRTKFLNRKIICALKRGIDIDNDKKVENAKDDQDKTRKGRKMLTMMPPPPHRLMIPSTSNRGL